MPADLSDAKEPARQVRTEVRGDVCVIRCDGADSAGLVAELPDEVDHCLGTDTAAALIDMDPAMAVDPVGISALSRAAAAFDAVGRELVIVVEQPEVRAKLVEAGLMPAEPVVPGPPEGIPGGPLHDRLHPLWEHEFSFSATPSELRDARHRIASLAEVAGLGERAVFEFSVAVAEALANAVLHGSPRGADDEVHVRFFCYVDEVAVEIVDQGEGIAAVPICAPSTKATSGRGIHFMRALTDAVHYMCGSLGTRVLLVKRRP